MRLEGGEYGLLAVKMSSTAQGPLYVVDPLHGGYYPTAQEAERIIENGRLMLDAPVETADDAAETPA